jgi:hypothetical protein
MAPFSEQRGAILERLARKQPFKTPHANPYNMLRHTRAPQASRVFDGHSAGAVLHPRPCSCAQVRIAPVMQPNRKAYANEQRQMLCRIGSAAGPPAATIIMMS